MVIIKNRAIHDSVEMKPRYTSSSIRPQPRVNMHRNAVVACVSGKQYEIYLQVDKKKQQNVDYRLL